MSEGCKIRDGVCAVCYVLNRICDGWFDKPVGEEAWEKAMMARRGLSSSVGAQSEVVRK